MNFTYKVGLSKVHAHISEEHVNILFGQDYKLTPETDTSYRHYDVKEKVDIVGPKGVINDVNINVSHIKETLVEIYMSDCILLGLIGDHIKDFTDLQELKNIHAMPNFKLRGPKGEVEVGKDDIFLLA